MDNYIEIRIVRDGNMWMAYRPDFINLAESVAGFGYSMPDALADLLESEEALLE